MGALLCFIIIHSSGGKFMVYCIIEKRRKERDSTMTNKWIKGDLDDMIFADCDWQPSER